MNLPRWLSSVRTVEQATALPSPLCRRLAGRRDSWLAALWALWILLLALPMTLGIIEGLRDPRWYRPILEPARLLGYLAISGAPLALVTALVLGVRTFKARFTAHRFMAAPWRLKCRYPTPSVMHSATVCPECGEPIPPEIATLAAQRAGEREMA